MRKALLFQQLCLMCLPSLLFALRPDIAITQYVHDLWQVQDGLPQNSIHCITQTKDGYLWFGTEEGIVRFDGVKFTIFDKYNTKEIRHNWISSLLEDRNGVLWIATHGGGLTKYKDGKFQAFTPTPESAEARIWPVYQDKKNNLWIGTNGGGVFKLKNEKIVASYTTHDGLLNNSVNSILEDHNDNIWLGTASGVNIVKEHSIEALPEIFSYVVSISEDSQRNIWIATVEGLYQFSNNQITKFTTKDGLSSDIVTSILEDRDGNLWFGTRGGGLNRLHAGKFVAFRAEDGLSSNSVWSLFEDREGSLWVGTGGDGLNRLRDGKFLTYTKREGLPYDHIWSIYENKVGNFWIGSEGAVVQRFKDGKLKQWNTNDGLSSNLVLCVYEDSRGNVWVGTDGHGVNLLKAGENKFRTFRKAEGITNDFVWSIYEDHDGRIWIGTFGGGLNQYDNGRWIHYGKKDGLKNSFVHIMISDGNDGFWIGTENGLFHFQNGKFQSYEKSHGLSSMEILSLYRDHEGTLWMGTRNGGLNRFDNGKISSYRKKDGLFDDNISQILEDDSGNLWLSSNRGISRVTKKDLKDFSAGKINSIRSIVFGIADGMKSSECNGGYSPGALKSKDGRLWFPTIRGIVVIDPKNIKKNKNLPPVRVERLIIDEKPAVLETTNLLKIDPGKKKVEFHYTALSFLEPSKVNFRYMLEGFDKTWIDAETRRTAYYTNIPPGQYRFRVIASNNDGLWNEAGASLQLYMKPFFYQSPWFFAACLGAVFVVALGTHRLRMIRLRKEFSVVLAERMRIAREIHDTLAQDLAGVLMQLEAAEEIQSLNESKSHIARARNLARKSLSQARFSVQSLRDQGQLPSDFVRKVESAAKEIVSDSKLQLEFQMNGTPRILSDTIQQNFIRIEQEALRNILKHADANRVSVQINYDSDFVDLSVIDNGKGFDIDKIEKNGHFGIVGMYERAEEIKGKLFIQTKPGNGVEVRIRASYSAGK